MLKDSVLEAGLQLLSAVGKMCQGQWRSSCDIRPPQALWKGVVRAEVKRWMGSIINDNCLHPLFQ